MKLKPVVFTKRKKQNSESELLDQAILSLIFHVFKNFMIIF